MYKFIYKKNKYIKRKSLSIFNVFFISLFLITLCIYISINRYNNMNYTDLDYAVKNYTTTGLFNKNKLYSLDNYEIKFSDNTFCIVEVTGIDSHPPYKTIRYDIHLEKNSKNIWKIKNIYHIDDVFNK